MSLTRLNDAPVLDQLDGQWQRLMAIVLWKYHRGETLKLTVADMQAFQRDADAGEAVVFTHGHVDSIDLAVITEERARVLAAHDRTQRGTA